MIWLIVNLEIRNPTGEGNLSLTTQVRNFFPKWRCMPKRGSPTKRSLLRSDWGPQTFCEKKSQYRELSEVLARGRATITAAVRAKFLAMALGGIKTKSTVVRKLKDQDGNLTGEEELQVSESELAPNLQAMSVWLYHHDEEWRKIERRQDEENDLHRENGIDIDKWMEENESED